jgi:hypothetical protein
MHVKAEGLIVCTYMTGINSGDICIVMTKTLMNLSWCMEFM